MQLFAPNRSYYLSCIFLQVGKIKVPAKRGLKILWIHCQNFLLKMTNGIRKVRLGVDIFDKRILDSCKFISYSASEYCLVYGNLFLAAGRVKTGFIVYGTQPIRILLFMFPFFLFLAKGRGKRSIE